MRARLAIGLVGPIDRAIGASTYVCDGRMIRKHGATCEVEEGNDARPDGTHRLLWKTTECTLDATSFTAKDGSGRDVKLEVAGTALWDSLMKETVATKVASLAEGKAKQRELAKKP